MATLFEIEEWWRHNGCYDREQASGIPYTADNSCDARYYLEETDTWWDGLTDEEKTKIYEEFFSEV